MFIKFDSSYKEISIRKKNGGKNHTDKFIVYDSFDLVKVIFSIVTRLQVIIPLFKWGISISSQSEGIILDNALSQRASKIMPCEQCFGFTKW